MSELQLHTTVIKLQLITITSFITPTLAYISPVINYFYHIYLLLS